MTKYLKAKTIIANLEKPIFTGNRSFLKNRKRLIKAIDECLGMNAAIEQWTLDPTLPPDKDEFDGLTKQRDNIIIAVVKALNGNHLLASSSKKEIKDENT